MILQTLQKCTHALFIMVVFILKCIPLLDSRYCSMDSCIVDRVGSSTAAVLDTYSSPRSASGRQTRIFENCMIWMTKSIQIPREVNKWKWKYVMTLDNEFKKLFILEKLLQPFIFANNQTWNVLRVFTFANLAKICKIRKNLMSGNLRSI